MKFDYYEFNIASHYASAIINGDYSGLSDEEENELNEFLSQYPDVSHWDCNYETNFTRDAISGLMADCLEFKGFIPLYD